MKAQYIAQPRQHINEDQRPVVSSDDAMRRHEYPLPPPARLSLSPLGVIVPIIISPTFNNIRTNQCVQFGRARHRATLWVDEKVRVKRVMIVLAMGVLGSELDGRLRTMECRSWAEFAVKAFLGSQGRGGDREVGCCCRTAQKPNRALWVIRKPSISIHLAGVLLIGVVAVSSFTAAALGPEYIVYTCRWWL